MAFIIKPIVPPALLAFVALCLLHWSSFISLPVSTFLFWGAATIVLLLINYLSPRSLSVEASTAALYIAVASMGAMLIGMAVNPAYMVLAAFIGAFLGEFAFSRTPKGRYITFPSSVFIHYFCAVGLGIIVTVSMMGLALEGFIRN